MAINSDEAISSSNTLEKTATGSQSSQYKNNGSLHTTMKKQQVMRGLQRSLNVDEETWVQVGEDIDGEAAYDYFGISVSMNDDGSRVIIGGYFNDGANGIDSGHARVFEEDAVSSIPSTTPSEIPSSASSFFPSSLSPTNIGKCIGGLKVKVQILTDFYPEEISWDIKTSNGTVAMKNQYFEDALALYEKTACLDKMDTCGGTDYTFTIYDSFGDGICCGKKTGDGFYRILIEDEEVACGGSDFGFEKSISLCGVQSSSPTAAPTPLPTSSPPTFIPECRNIGKRKPCVGEDGCFWKNNEEGGVPAGKCLPCSIISRQERCPIQQGCAWNQSKNICE